MGVGGNSAATGEIRIYEDTDNGSHYTGFKAGNNTASVAYVLPTADGSAGTQLTTDGSGTLSWAASTLALANDGNNRITTGTGSGGLNAEANLTFDGSTLTVTPAADYNGDGYQDLYVTNLGPNVLYRNNGDNTFTDVTADAGVKCDLLSTSSAFADIDQDGDLDLYVCNYVGYSLDSDIPCYYQDMRIYCGPNDYQGIEDTLYRNNGDGTFTDVTQVSGTYVPDTRGLGVVFTDLNNDGLDEILISYPGSLAAYDYHATL